MGLQFWVSLIVVSKNQTEEAKESLEANCTYVDNDCWIFEGDLWALEEDGVVFNIIGEGAVPCLGDMSKQDLIELCYDTFGINVETESYKQYIGKE